MKPNDASVNVPVTARVREREGSPLYTLFALHCLTLARVVTLMARSAAIKYGIIGCCGGIASLFGYLLGGELAPGPYGKFETGGSLNPTAVMEQYIGAVLIGFLFFGLYAGTLTLMQRAFRIDAAPAKALIVIDGATVAVQAAASIGTIIFLRSQVGWNLNEGISLPIEVAGFTAPGLLVACIALWMTSAAALKPQL